MMTANCELNWIVTMRQDKTSDEYNSRPHVPRDKSEVRTEGNEILFK